MSKKSKGFTLIEILVFILVIGILAAGLLTGINNALRYTDAPRKNTEASFLANARLQIILMNRGVNGYGTLNDPCTASPALAICTPLSSYATANNFTVGAPTISGTNPKTISISVSGAGNAVTETRVYDYANN